MSHVEEKKGPGTAYNTPLWVKIFGIIALVLVLLVGIMLLSGGEHGPGRHMPPAEHSMQQP
jgi:hypothetical protein